MGAPLGAVAQSGDTPLVELTRESPSIEDRPEWRKLWEQSAMSAT